MSGAEEGPDTAFTRELAALINKFSLENRSNTPDFILAEFLRHCLSGLTIAVLERDDWFGLGHESEAKV